MSLVGLGDRRERDDLLSFLLEEMAIEVVLMQALHDNDDRAPGLVVEAGIERAVVPIVAGDSATFRHRVGGFELIVDEDEISPAGGEHAPDRGRHPKPALVVTSSWSGARPEVRAMLVESQVSSTKTSF